MATKAEESSSSWISFLKEALVLPTRNPKLFSPIYLLIVIFYCLVLFTNVLSVQPLAVDITLHAYKLKNTDPASDEYTRLLEEIQQEVKQIVVITITLLLTSTVTNFAKQIITYFAAFTTYSGDRYSLAELISKAIRNNLRGPLVTVAFVYVLDATSMVLLSVLVVYISQCPSGVVLLLGWLLFALAILLFVYFNVVCLVGVAVSVAEPGCLAVRALRRAWQLMKLKRKEAWAMVLVPNLLDGVLYPLNMFGVKFAHKSSVLGLSLLFVYALLVGVVQLFVYGAGTIYYYECKGSKEVMANDGYAKLPNGEAYV